MPVVEDLRLLAQTILDGPWKHASRALDACRARTWPDFVAATAPAAPGLIGRLDHRACVRRAASMFTGPSDLVVELIPVWWSGGGDDEAPSAEWYIAHASRVDGGPLAICETGPLAVDADPHLEVGVTCRARCWKVGQVVPTRSYSPAIELVLRRGDYGVLAGEILEVVEVTPAASVPLPRPATTVPPFCAWFEPRVAGLPDSVVAAIRQLSITTDEDDNLVPQPDVEG